MARGGWRRIPHGNVRTHYLDLVEAKIDLILIGPVPEVGFEFRPTLVEGDSMSECTDDGVRGRERELMRDDTDGFHCVPVSRL